eukprot:scaffold1044_cov120-Isochrysis_galbana.AAC.26
MTDPPIDHTHAREQDAPGTHDAKRRAPVHGHTGDLPPDKALSDTRGWSWTDLVQSPDVAAGASSCKGAEGRAMPITAVRMGRLTTITPGAAVAVGLPSGAIGGAMAGTPPNRGSGALATIAPAGPAAP